MSFPTLRPYQQSAVYSMVRELLYRPSTLRVACTGSGKTAEIGALTRIALRKNQRVLITAPRGELLDQAEKWIRLWNPGLRPPVIGREQADSTAHEGHRVVLASLQSLRPDRLNRMPKPDLMVHDEAHLHIDKLYELARLWPSSRRAGFTATPDRSDLRALVPRLFESCPRDQVYEIATAIRDGFLTPPKFKRIHLEGLALDQVRVGKEGEGAGDFSPGSLAQQMLRQAVLFDTAEIIHRTRPHPTLAFGVNVEHARALVRALNTWEPGAAALAVGELSATERADTLNAFQNGDIRILVTVVLLTYGWDAPRCSCVVMARPTLSRALYCQSIGRGLRLHEGKDQCLVLDIVGNTESHTLMTPDEALKPQFDDKMEWRCQGGLQGDEGARDHEADRDMRHLDDTDIPEEPSGKSFEVSEVRNQLEPLGIELPERAPGAPAATLKQQATLKKMGVEGAHELSIRQASDLIEELVKRQQAGYCSLRQARALWRAGLNPLASAKKASWAIGRISAAGWRVPMDVKADPELVAPKAGVALR